MSSRIQQDVRQYARKHLLSVCAFLLLVFDAGSSDARSGRRAPFAPPDRSRQSHAAFSKPRPRRVHPHVTFFSVGDGNYGVRYGNVRGANLSQVGPARYGHKQIVVRRTVAEQLVQAYTYGGVAIRIMSPTLRWYRDRHVRNKPRSDLRAVGKILSALRAHSPFFRAHGRRVGKLLEAIARELGVSDTEQLRRFRWAGTLHDVGKVIFSPKLITSRKKRSELSPAFAEQIESHPEVGSVMLEPLVKNNSLLDTAMVEAVLGHHENLRGTGYPNKLPGSRIPKITQWLSVADNYDAISVPRSYNKDVQHQANAIIQRKATTGILDLEAADAMARIANEPSIKKMIGDARAFPLPAVVELPDR